jgi:hypothetical protein
MSETGTGIRRPRHWLAWSAAALAAMLCVAAFVLWGFNGPSMLLDMIVALCL